MLRRLFDNCGAKLDNGKARADKKVRHYHTTASRPGVGGFLLQTRQHDLKLGDRLNICNNMLALIHGVLEVKDIFDIAATKLVISLFSYS